MAKRAIPTGRIAVLLDAQSPAGYFPLREAIAGHISITRGVRCTPEQVIVTADSQGAIDLATRTLLNPGEAAWLENPGYFGARCRPREPS